LVSEAKPLREKSTSWHRFSIWACLITLLSCRGRPQELPHSVDRSLHAATAGVPSGVRSTVDVDARTRPGPSPAVFVVDEGGLSIRGQRIDVPVSNGAQRTLDEIVVGASPGQGAVSLYAARGAAARGVSALVEALGKTGVEEIDVITPTSGAGQKSARLKVSPLAQVPEHEDRCGARITLMGDRSGELKYLQKGKATKLPPGPQGPDVSQALDDLRSPMKGCGSTVWMLAGAGDVRWGPAFDVGTDVAKAQGIPAPRYVMVL
jgi:hypothetical protein